MKFKNLFTLSVFLVITRCNYRVSPEIINAITAPDQENHWTKSQIEQNSDTTYKVDLAMASYFAKIFCPDRNISSIEIKIDDRDTLFYLINFENGWVVISSDRRTEPTLAFSKDGHKKNENSDDLGWKIMSETISNYIKQLKYEDSTIDNTSVWEMWRKIEYITHQKKFLVKAQTPKTKGYWLEGEYHDEPYWILEPISMEIEQVSDITTGPLIQTKWGQKYPWNRFLPTIDGRTCPMGCVAVAVSQMLVFHHSFLGEPCGLYHEISFEPSFQNGSHIILSDYHPESIRWQYMPTNKFGSNTSYVCDLMAEVGHAVNMQYSPGGSAANLLPYMLSGYNLTCQRSAYSIIPVINELENEEPVIVGGSFFLGYDPFDNTPLYGNHMWIIDTKRTETYRTRTTNRWTYVAPEDCDCFEEEIEIVDGDDYYLTYEEGLRRNPTEELYTVDYGVPYSYHHISMNWGDDGDGDDVEYSLYPTSAWEYRAHPFAPQYSVFLWHNFDTL